MLLVALLFFLIAWILCSHDCVKPRKYPPGPKWLPFVGAFPVFQRMKKRYYYVHTVLEELTKEYGPVLGIKLGRQRFVVISGNELVRKALMRDEFNGRPDGFFFRVRAFGKRRGVLFIDGQEWTQTRKSTTRHLRSFGFGQGVMENYLKTEANALVTHLRDEVERTGEGALALQGIFDVTVLNTLWMMIAGYRFSYDDSRLRNILSVVHDAFRSSDTLGGILSHLPFLRFVIPELSGYNHLMATHQKLWSFIQDEIEEHLKTMRRDRPPKDFIEAFLLESESSYDREELVVLCLDLFMAGSKTTTDSLTAIFALALHHPEWIKSLQKDLDEIVGDAQPSLEHATLLPRVEAFLAEAHRILVLTPLGVPHKTMKNVSLEGYHIPKDTVVLFNYHSANIDETCWDKPDEFRPERFLDDNGQYRRRSEFLPFGLGKRRCLGEVLARASLFLFFTSIIHNFHLELPKNQDPPRLDGIDGFTVSPRPYLIKLTPRKYQYKCC